MAVPYILPQDNVLLGRTLITHVNALLDPSQIYCQRIIIPHNFLFLQVTKNA